MCSKLHTQIAQQPTPSIVSPLNSHSVYRDNHSPNESPTYEGTDSQIRAKHAANKGLWEKESTADRGAAEQL